MRRREFIVGLGVAAASSTAWPHAAVAQQRALPVLGYLDLLGPHEGALTLNLFYKALNEAGLVEGRDIAFEVRWAEGHADRLPALAADLVRRRVDVIVTPSATSVALAARAATATVPIVFTMGEDPVRAGIVASLNRPGGNATGVNFYVINLVSKRLEMLRELVPDASTIAILVNPSNAATTEVVMKEIQTQAQRVGQRIAFFRAITPTEIDEAFAGMAQQQIGALLVNGDRVFAGQLDRIIALASRYRIPASYFSRSFVEAGGLMSYSDDRLESWRLVTKYVGRILKGEKPTDLPVMQPTKFDLVINLKTAKALGLTIPVTLWATATEVIE
jgi:putative tryptophan/tyrosine transport system substrate-binding protein